MIKRPILIITLCYIIAILWGIYLKKYISHFCLCLLIINAVIFRVQIKREFNKKMQVVKNKKKQRNLLYICILVIFICSLLICYKDNKFYNFNIENDYINAIAIVVEVKPESEYYYNYVVKVTNCNHNKCDNKMNLMVKKNKSKEQLKYADLLQLSGSFEKGEVQRNYKGYSQFNYFKQQNIYGTIKSENIKIIKHKSTNGYNMWINSIRVHIKEALSELLAEENLGIANALLIGDTSLLSNEQKNVFSNANLSHILAISGMHVSYIIMGLSVLLKKVSNRQSKYLFIVALVFFANLTGGAPSVLRAVIMSVLGLVASLIYRKQDTLNSISISALAILIYNPYYLFNLGFQLSFLGTLGIVLFNTRINLKTIRILKSIIKYMDRNKSLINKIISNKRCKKIIKRIIELISVSISANLLIFPIIIYNFNKISLIFLISNLLVTPVLAVLVFSGYIVVICSFISNKIAFIPAIIFNYLIKCFLKIAEFSSSIDFTKVVIGTPKIFTIVLIYVFIFVIFYYSKIFNFMLNLAKEFPKSNASQLNENQLKGVVKFLAILILAICGFNEIACKYNSNFLIHFVDVGQGDCSLIITTSNKKILIDGGGSETGNYDVGNKVVVPYLLDRKITSIDYLIFSHFDSDHCLGLFSVMEELKVRNAIISDQSKNSGNYEFFCKLAKEKRVNVIKVRAGYKLQIDRYTAIQFLWPVENQLTTNPLNNNSIVCKIFYRNVSILFTGDIEEPAEKELFKLYKNELKADVLKVAHHGSITSSTEEFLNAVKPRVALIGVGENNKFGHPNEDVLYRLNTVRYSNF